MNATQKTIESLDLFNPSNGKTYTYKGLVPARRISDSCTYDSHEGCVASPSNYLTQFGFEFAKKHCCLCQCHFTKEAN